MERATCARSRVPVVRVSISALPPNDRMLIGAFPKNTANVVWEHTVLAAATSDTPILLIPACQHPYAKPRIIN